jgi:hemolysin III
MKTEVKYYERKEEMLNVATHGLGVGLSIAALVLLVVYASLEGDVWHVVSFSIYGASLFFLYLASTSFHLSRKLTHRQWLNVADHAAIFLLIAGTYTPYSLVSLRGPWGWSIFGVVWGLAIVGMVLKIFYTGRFNLISTLIYVLLGWLILIAISPLVDTLPTGGLLWLLAGGISYTMGALFFLLQRIPFNHAIFHLFVLAGSVCHFVSVFWYILR